jgi:uncharacterized membrane protein
LAIRESNKAINKVRRTSFMGFHLQPKMKMQWNRWIRRIYMQRNSFADGLLTGGKTKHISFFMVTPKTTL